MLRIQRPLFLKWLLHNKEKLPAPWPSCLLCWRRQAQWRLLQEASNNLQRSRQQPGADTAQSGQPDHQKGRRRRHAFLGSALWGPQHLLLVAILSTGTKAELRGKHLPWSSLSLPPPCPHLWDAPFSASVRHRHLSVMGHLPHHTANPPVPMSPISRPTRTSSCWLKKVSLRAQQSIRTDLVFSDPFPYDFLVTFFSFKIFCIWHWSLTLCIYCTLIKNMLLLVITIGFPKKTCILAPTAGLGICADRFCTFLLERCHVTAASDGNNWSSTQLAQYPRGKMQTFTQYVSLCGASSKHPSEAQGGLSPHCPKHLVICRVHTWHCWLSTTTRLPSSFSEWTFTSPYPVHSAQCREKKAKLGIRMPGFELCTIPAALAQLLNLSTFQYL